MRVCALVCGDVAAQCRQGCCDGWGAGQSLIRRAPLSRRQGCPAGKVTSVPGAKTADDCVACPKGTFAVTESSACTDCPAGTYRDTEEGQSVAACDACEAGKYSDIKRAVAESTCLECLAGTFAEAGDTVCTLCGADTYAEGGASECTACADDQISPSGSASQAACQCDGGLVNDGDGGCDVSVVDVMPEKESCDARALCGG
jgi:hypothetical protein